MSTTPPWADSTNPAFPAGTQSDGRITRDEVIRRAATWVEKNVPYSQTAWWHDDDLGTYRTDCSGFVSMAWHLNETTNYWTGNLAVVSQSIADGDLLKAAEGDLLRKGDILLSDSHTLIFHEWADPAHTAFYMYEMAKPGTTARHVIGSVTYHLDKGFVPYRYNGIVDAGDPLLVPVALVQPAPPMLELLGPLELPWTGGRQGWARLERLDTGESVDQTVPVVFNGPSGTQPAPLIAAAVAGLFACAFPLTALAAPLRRTQRRH